MRFDARPAHRLFFRCGRTRLLEADRRHGRDSIDPTTRPRTHPLPVFPDDLDERRGRASTAPGFAVIRRLTHLRVGERDASARATETTAATIEPTRRLGQALGLTCTAVARWPLRGDAHQRGLHAAVEPATTSGRSRDGAEARKTPPRRRRRCGRREARRGAGEEGAHAAFAEEVPRRGAP